MKHSDTWQPTSWRSYEALQQPVYRDNLELEAALAEIRRLPPLVFVQEIRALKKEIAQAARGQPSAGVREQATRWRAAR